MIPLAVSCPFPSMYEIVDVYRSRLVKESTLITDSSIGNFAVHVMVDLLASQRPAISYETPALLNDRLRNWFPPSSAVSNSMVAKPPLMLKVRSIMTGSPFNRTAIR